MSWTLMRTFIPAFLTLPSSIVPTLSSGRISCMLLPPPLYFMTEVREITVSSGILEIAEMSSSVIPSAKYSSFGSGLMLANGRTAILLLS